MVKNAIVHEAPDLKSAIMNISSPQPASNSNTSQNFDRFLSDAENRSSEARETHDPRRRDNDDRLDRADRSERANRVNQSDQSGNQNRNQSQDGIRNDRHDYSDATEAAVTADTENAAETAQYDNAEYSYQNDVYSGGDDAVAVPEDIQKAIINIMAEALYVPQDVVYETLKNIDAEPENLTEPATANKYLQAFIKIKEPVEVLTIPEYQEAVKQLSEAVQEVMETKTAKPALDKLAGIAVHVDEQNQLVVTEEADVLLAAEADEESMFQMNSGSEQNARQENQGTAAAVQNTQASVNTAAAATAELPEVMLSDSQQTVTVAPQSAPAAVMAAQAAAIADTVQAARVDSGAVLEQIMAKVKTVSAGNFAELRIILKPEQLGDVSLRIAVQNGIVTAMFVAENQRIKEIIEQNFNALRDALAQQGIEVGDLFVSVNGNDSEDQMNQILKAQQEAMRRLKNAAGLAGEEEIEAEPEQETIKMDNTVEFTA